MKSIMTNPELPPKTATLTIDQALQQAIVHHNTGQWQDAERLYRAILQAQPNHPDANHNLGILAVHMKQPAAGLPHFKAALEAKPNLGRYWLSYIDALIQTGQMDIARKVLVQSRRQGFRGEAWDALASSLNHDENPTPDQSTAIDHATALRESGRYKEAALVLQNWLLNNPQDASAYALLAHVLSLDKQDEPAWAALNTALSINPALPIAQRNYSRLLLKTQKPVEALQAALEAYQYDTADPENQLVLAAAYGANGKIERAFELIANALQSRPNYAEAFATRSLLKLRNDDPVGALSDAETSLSIKPHLKQLWGMVGLLRNQIKNVPGAIDALEKALDYDPDNVGLLMNMGELKRLTGSVEAAIVLLEKAVAIAPDNAGAWVNLGTALQQTRRIHEAKAAYGKALEIVPEQAEVSSNLGVLAKEEGNWEEALRYFNQALLSAPTRVTIMTNRAAALNALERYEEAEQGARHVTEVEPTNIEAQLVLFSALVGQKHYESAQAVLDTLKLPNPDDIENNHLIILSYAAVFCTQNRWIEAEAWVRRALQIKPDYAEAHNNLGNTLHKQGRLTEAEASYRRALEIKPHFPEAYYNLGITSHEQGRIAEAKDSFRRALEIKPDYAEAHNNLGNILYVQGRLTDAETCYRRALEIKSDYAEAHSNLGNTLKDLGRLDEAEGNYRRALEIKPGYAEAYYNLGIALKDMSRLDEALVSYRLSLKAKTDWKEALRRLTTPLVLHTGMILDPQCLTNHANTCRQANTLQEHVVHPTTTTHPLSARQEAYSLEEKYLEPGIVKKLRIVLIYPPPWQIPPPCDTLPGMPFGPPRDRYDLDLDGDFQIIPYGLLTIAAQAISGGHDVRVYNLSACPWHDVVSLIAETEADIYGISAYTANRRGMGAVAALIRQHHPQTHITAGGPFVTALPLETLRYYRDIDTAVIGEGENTFMELLECLGSGRSTVDIPGTAWRNGEEVAFGPARQRIKDLNVLASPFDYFTNFIVMTSRGCPNKCTFCGSFTTWGKILRFHSAEYCLDTFKKALARLPVPVLAIKDDTFTANRQRAIAICDAIIENNMNFIWSCDTRVDCLDDELLRKMRLAGCQMISLGIESGSPEILKTIRKETTPEMILEATRAAQKYGMYVRYYMILCNRGETAETIRHSNDLIKAGRPNCYLYYPLSFYPGTEDWEILREKQGLTADIFFRNDFKELNVATNRHNELQDVLLHIVCDIGAVYGFSYTVEERETVVDRLPNLHIAQVELANAYFRAGRLDEATTALNRAEELAFPIEGIIHNQRACIALARCDIDNALTFLERTLKYYPHKIVIKNHKILSAWSAAPFNDRGKPPVLNDSVLAIDFNSQLQPHSGHKIAL